MLGATGSGKSFTLNFLLVEALRYDPRVLILDLGGSYRWLTRFLGGRYLELSPGEAEPTLRLAAVRAPPNHEDLPVPDGLGATAAEARRLGGEWRGHERDPGTDRGPLRVRAGAADAERLGKLASVRDVAGLEPLDRRRRLGRVLRQPGKR